MRIVVTGASGFIGIPLVRHLKNQNHQVTILTRSVKMQTGPVSADESVKYALWNPQDENGVIGEIDGADAVINLAGENVAARRWTSGQKRLILESRVHATEIVVRSMRRASIKPKILVNASAIGYYGSRGESIIDENTAPGGGFLAHVAQAWEKASMEAETFGVRVVRLRIGMVLDQSGGALGKMLPVFKLGLGGPIAGGEQWMSWIQFEDLMALISFILENEQARGPINAVSPNPVTNRFFSESLARVLKKPCFFGVPAFALKLLLGEVSELMLASHRARPTKALELGFKFSTPDLESALQRSLQQARRP